LSICSSNHNTPVLLPRCFCQAGCRAALNSIETDPPRQELH
jgi:hypothetical protein